MAAPPAPNTRGRGAHGALPSRGGSKCGASETVTARPCRAGRPAFYVGGRATREGARVECLSPFNHTWTCIFIPEGFDSHEVHPAIPSPGSFPRFDQSPWSFTSPPGGCLGLAPARAR